jgi:filamentous hemagglutinin family protein
MKNLTTFSIAPLTVAILLAYSGATLAQTTASTLPAAPVVVNGTVGISSPAAAVMQVTNTPGAIVNWGSFSIGSGARVTFDQTGGAGSAILNRVTGANPSEIMGRLESNGRVFLVNPNGVLFGATSVVDAQSLIASTRDISDSNFLNGNYLFEGASAGAINVANGAVISTAARGAKGQVWLFADKLNLEQGSQVTVPDGQAVLAAGSRLQVGSTSLGNMSFSVATAAGNTIGNYGTIAAERGAAGLFADSIVQGGKVATGGGAGEVMFMAARDVAVKDGAVIDANGTFGQPGGKITLNAGNRLQIGGTASVSADGSVEGGSGGRIDLVAYDLQVSSVTNGMGNVHASGRAPGAPNGEVRVMSRSTPIDAASTGQLPVTLDPLKDMYPAVTHLADGSFVVTWMGLNLPPNVLWDVTYATVYAQRFSASGQPLSGRIQLASQTGGQSYPSITPGRDGGFLVAWSDGRTGRREVWGRVFDANAMPKGSEVKLSIDAGDQDNVKVATLADGRYLTTWSSRSSISPLVIDIRAQFVDANGMPQGPAFTVNVAGTGDKGSQYRPEIAPLADGGFVVTYHAIASGGYQADAYGRRFDRAGLPLGPEFMIAATSQSDWRVATKGLLDGGYVVVWDTVDSTGANKIFYRRYDARGLMMTPDTPIGAAAGGAGQSFAQVAPLSDGGFVVAWMSYQNGTGTSNADVYAQRFTATGMPTSAPKLLAGGVAAQWEPRIAATADGGYTVTWYTNQNGGYFDIMAQRFSSLPQQATVAGGVVGELKNTGYATAQGLSNGQVSAPVLVVPTTTSTTPTTTTTTATTTTTTTDPAPTDTTAVDTTTTSGSTTTTTTTTTTTKGSKSKTESSLNDVRTVTPSSRSK